MLWQKLKSAWVILDKPLSPLEQRLYIYTVPLITIWGVWSINRNLKRSLKKLEALTNQIQNPRSSTR